MCRTLNLELLFLSVDEQSEAAVNCLNAVFGVLERELFLETPL